MRQKYTSSPYIRLLASRAADGKDSHSGHSKIAWPTVLRAVTGIWIYWYCVTSVTAVPSTSALL
eukprot:4764762-Pleurochrysis_carterae.AAC.2